VNQNGYRKPTVLLVDDEDMVITSIKAFLQLDTDFDIQGFTDPEAAARYATENPVDVVVSERQPIGIGRIHSEMYLVDERGVIIDQYGPQYADFDLPIIDGLSAAPGTGGSLTDEARADLAARVIAAAKSKPSVGRRLSQVDVSDLHNAAVILEGDPAVIQLGEDQFLARLQSYLDLAPTLRERVAEIDNIDLRFDDRIYVRPAKAAKGKTILERKTR